MTLLRNRVKQKGQVDMKKIEQGSPGMERAMKSLEQAKARYEGDILCLSYKNGSYR